MSFPYITDIANALLGTHWALPIPTFGVVVAAAIVIATSVARRETKRLEAVGKLPLGAHLVVGDRALVSATLCPSGLGRLCLPSRRALVFSCWGLSLGAVAGDDGRR